MKYIKFLMGLSLACLCSVAGFAQKAAPVNEEVQDFGLTPRQAESIRSRWYRSQPVVILNIAGKQQLTGQPIHFGKGNVFVYTKTGPPVGGDWQNDMVAVPFSEINSISLQRGGNWIQRARTSRFYALKPAGTEMAGRAIKRLHYAGVYRDSIVAARNLPEAFRHSRVLRNVFPKKHVRISFGVGLGGDVVSEDIMEALSGSTFNEPQYGYGITNNVEWADIAFRIFNRYMIGWQYNSLPNYAFWDYYSSGKDAYFSYNNNIRFFEHRIYAECALFNVDRYFTRHFEWTVGAGINFARIEKSYDYFYEDYSDPENLTTDYLNDQITGRITGFQLKSLFHYFFIPGVSLYVGVETSFYEKWMIPEQVFPSGIPGGQITLPGYEISLNSVRFRTGVSIYL